MFKRKKKPPTLVWIRCRDCGPHAIHGVFKRGTKTGVSPVDLQRHDVEYFCPTKGRNVAVSGGEEAVILEKKT